MYILMLFEWFHNILAMQRIKKLPKHVQATMTERAAGNILRQRRNFPQFLRNQSNLKHHINLALYMCNEKERVCVKDGTDKNRISLNYDDKLCTHTEKKEYNDDHNNDDTISLVMFIITIGCC